VALPDHETGLNDSGMRCRKAPDKIRVFIMSSAESLEIARAIQNAFSTTLLGCHLGRLGVFQRPIEGWEAEVDQSGLRDSRRPREMTVRPAVAGRLADAAGQCRV